MIPQLNRLSYHAVSFIRHFISAGNEHHVHSPFVFRLLTEGIYSKKEEPGFVKIENIRKQLLNDDTPIRVTDLGAGSSFDGRLQVRTISEITRKFAKSPKHCRFLFRLTNYFKPPVMVELGTSLGISAMYQSAGNPNGKMYTLEGCPETAKAATVNFIKNNFNNIETITGDFDHTLSQLLSNLNKIGYAYIDGNHTREATLRYFHLLKKHATTETVLVFDDINWSDGMKQAWKEIMQDPGVTTTLDFYQFGVVFFNTALSKQHFRLRLT